MQVEETVEVEEFTTVNALKQLRGEWEQLWESVPRATPFQSPHWLMPWWKYFGQGDLWVLALRAEGRLTGVAPLFIHRKLDSSLREVLWIGNGISDYADALLAPGWEELGAQALTRYLAEHSQLWDDCDLQQLPEDSPMIRTAVPSDWIEERGIQDVCPLLTLPRKVEELGNFVPVHQLDNLRYYRARAEKAGRVSYARAEAGNFDELFQSFLQLHRARSQMRDNCGLLSDPAIQAFHGEAARGMLSRGLLRLEVLFIDGQSVAAFYGFAHGPRIYYYLGGFDPNFAHLSLGSILVGHVIEKGIREGMEEFDFMRGRESYKYLWGGKDRFNYRRRLYKNSEIAYQQK